MEKKVLLTKILAIPGMVLVWFPILAPVLLMIVSIFEDGRLRFDYLLPAELFPAALVGGVLLIWASLRAHSRRGLIIWGLMVGVVSLFGGLVLAVVTGAASSETDPSGWLMAVLTGTMVVYTLARILTGVGGVLLLIDLFKPNSSALRPA